MNVLLLITQFLHCSFQFKKCIKILNTQRWKSGWEKIKNNFIFNKKRIGFQSSQDADVISCNAKSGSMPTSVFWVSRFFISIPSLCYMASARTIHWIFHSPNSSCFVLFCFEWDYVSSQLKPQCIFSANFIHSFLLSPQSPHSVAGNLACWSGFPLPLFHLKKIIHLPF
jgi:hypothetical protein